MAEDIITFEIIPTFEIVGGPEMLSQPQALDWRDLLHYHISSALRPKPTKPLTLYQRVQQVIAPQDSLEDERQLIDALLHDLFEDNF